MEPQTLRVHVDEVGGFDEWNEIEPSTIAYWAHCQSGLTHAEFIQWIAGELSLLEAIDPGCSK
jgi:hypothetical protein